MVHASPHIGVRERDEHVLFSHRKVIPFPCNSLRDCGENFFFSHSKIISYPHNSAWYRDE